MSRFAVQIMLLNLNFHSHQVEHSVQDLATAFIAVLGNPKASKEIFNISGEKYVTFDGLARACAKVILKLQLNI